MEIWIYKNLICYQNQYLFHVLIRFGSPKVQKKIANGKFIARLRHPPALLSALYATSCGIIAPCSTFT